MQENLKKTQQVCSLFQGYVEYRVAGVGIVLQAYSLDGTPVTPYQLTPFFPDAALLESFCDRHWVEFLSWDMTTRDEGVMVRPFWELQSAA